MPNTSQGGAFIPPVFLLESQVAEYQRLVDQGLTSAEAQTLAEPDAEDAVFDDPDNDVCECDDCIYWRNGDEGEPCDDPEPTGALTITDSAEDIERWIESLA